MDFLEKIVEKWNNFVEKVTPACGTVKEGGGQVFDFISNAFNYVVKLRKIFLAIPIAVGAIWLAVYNEASLPAIVGLGLQTNGDFNLQIIRELAVLAPLVITGISLLLMFCSRRVLTPWLVSLFTLTIPIVILICNTFPA